MTGIHWRLARSDALVLGQSLSANPFAGSIRFQHKWIPRAEARRLERLLWDMAKHREREA